MGGVYVGPLACYDSFCDFHDKASRHRRVGWLALFHRVACSGQNNRIENASAYPRIRLESSYLQGLRLRRRLRQGAEGVGHTAKENAQ